MAVDKTDRSLGTLFSDLTRDTVDLVRQEIALARTEMSEKVNTAQAALASMAVGAAVILAGLFLVLQAVVHALAQVLPPDMAPWLAPLLVGLVVALIGWAMLRAGRSKLDPDNLVPRRTMDSLRRDKAAVVQERT
jgi:protein-S-isoprenylcysteine O-methyltransferase Ste14